MPQYIILLYDDPKKFAELSPQEMQEAFKKYYGWGQKMREQGRLTGSNKLTSVEHLAADIDEVLARDARFGAIPPLWDGHASERIVDSLLARVR